MLQRTRCQGAILRDHQILLITHREHDTGRSYWVIPGGGLEPGETPEQCTRREMQEETGLEVQVGRLLFEEEGVRGSVEWRKLTYLCEILSGDPSPGYEPEPEASAHYSITAVGWFDLRDPQSWGALVHNDPFTCPLLLRLRAVLGYAQS
jgi:8-oxo-dGTP diphosphatase